MRQGSVWYDTCPVCEGRGTIPCSTCSGTGHMRDAELGRTILHLVKGESVGPAPKIGRNEWTPTES